MPPRSTTSSAAPVDAALAADALPIRYSFANPRRVRVTQPISDLPSRTKQEFKDDCDVNRILSRYQRTGALTHFAKYAPHYGDITAIDYQTSQNILIRAQQMFDALPSQVRKLVSTPAGFLDFVQDPKNAAKMEELGLKPRSDPQPVADPVPPTPTPIPA